MKTIEEIGDDESVPTTRKVSTDLQQPLAGRVLVVDDHAGLVNRWRISCVIAVIAFNVVRAGSRSLARVLVITKHFDVIITDLRMPGMSGLEFIQALEKRQSEAQVVMVTAYASVATAVEAMRHGAFDYIEKPFNVDQLEQLVTRALRQGDIGGRRSLP